MFMFVNCHCKGFISENVFLIVGLLLHSMHENDHETYIYVM